MYYPWLVVCGYIDEREANCTEGERIMAWQTETKAPESMWEVNLSLILKCRSVTETRWLLWRWGY